MTDAFGAELRRLRQLENMNQDDVAEALEVTRTTISEWENARYRPSRERVSQLDRVLRADGQLLRAWDANGGSSSTPTIRSAGLQDVRRRIVGQLVATLRTRPTDAHGNEAISDDRDPRGGARKNVLHLGWPQYFDDANGNPAPLSTAYGVKLLMLCDYPAVPSEHRTIFLSDLIESLRKSAEERSGGVLLYKARAQRGPRPEASAIVVDALARAGLESNKVRGSVAALLEQLDPKGRSGGDVVGWQRPLVVSTVLTVVSRLGDARDAERLVDRLIELRNDDGSWSEQSTEGSRPQPEPSVVHTARALYSLCHVAQHPGVAIKVTDAVDAAREWLLRYAKYTSRDEQLRRYGETTPEKKDENLPWRHFTSAWVVRGLIASGVSPQDTVVRAALAQVWDQYDGDFGVWKWKTTGELPIWMTYHGLAAVEVAARAGYAVPAGTLSNDLLTGAMAAPASVS